MRQVTNNLNHVATIGDIEAMIERGAKVRLAKGAFAEGPDITFTKHRDIEANYCKLVI